MSIEREKLRNRESDRDRKIRNYLYDDFGKAGCGIPHTCIYIVRTVAENNLIEKFCHHNVSYCYFITLSGLSIFKHVAKTSPNAIPPSHETIMNCNQAVFAAHDFGNFHK